MSVLIDKTGWPIIKDWGTTSESYMVDTNTPNVTYICYSAAPKRIIRRISVANNITTVEYGYGAWADRATLTYVGINEALEVAEP